MPNRILQILRLLRFAGLTLLVGSVASASAQTVREHLKKDPGFRIYAVVFGVTATTTRNPQRFDWSRSGRFQDSRARVRTR